MVLMDPGDAGSDSVRITKILVLGIEPNIREGVGAGTGQPHREDLRCEPKGADFLRMVAKIRLDCGPPVGGDTADRALTDSIDPEGLLRVGRQRAIAAELQIE